MLTLVGDTASVRDLAYTPDGRHLLSGDEGGAIRLWTLNDGSARRLATKGPSVETVAVSPRGDLFAAGNSNGKLILGELASGRSFHDADAHPAGVRRVAFTPEGSELISVGWDREVCRWPTSRPQRSKIGSILDEPPASLAVTPDGRIAAVGLSHTYKILLFDLVQGAPDRSLTSNEGAVFALAFSPDGRWLAAGDTQGRILFWEVADPHEPRVLHGHTWTVYGLAFTPDGQRLLSAGADGGVCRVWDVSDGHVLHAYQWHDTWSTCLAVSPDGLTAASGGDDGKIVVWDLGD